MQTIDPAYLDQEFIETPGVMEGLLEGAVASDNNYYIKDNENGTESVFYFTDSGTPFYLGDRDNMPMAGNLGGAEPEALPMEAPAGSESVTPAEFGMDVANFAKGFATGFLGLPGDIAAVANGLYEIGARGGDVSRTQAFLTGLQEGTFLPTTESINTWVDENVPLPDRMKTSQPEGVPDTMVRGVVDPQAEGPINAEGDAAPYIGNVTGTMGELVAPGGLATMVVKGAVKGGKVVGKAASKLIKRVPAKEIPKLFSHGTSEAAADGIMSSGKFDPSAGTRNYSYSEFGRKAIYLTPEGGWWLDPKKSIEGRATKYDASVITQIDPKAKIFRVDSIEDLEKLAKKSGFNGAEDLMRSIGVENLDYLNQAKKAKSMNFDEFVDDYVAQEASVFADIPGSGKIKSLDDLNAFREQEGLSGFNMTLDEIKVMYEDAKTFEAKNFKESDQATQKLIDAGIDGIYVGPDFKRSDEIFSGGPAPDQLALFRPELVKPTGKKSLRQADSTATIDKEQKAK